MTAIADLAASLESVAADAPTVEAVEAETTEVQSAVDAELGGQESAAPEALTEPPQQVTNLRPTVSQIRGSPRSTSTTMRRNSDTRPTASTFRGHRTSSRTRRRRIYRLAYCITGWHRTGLRRLDQHLRELQFSDRRHSNLLQTDFTDILGAQLARLGCAGQMELGELMEENMFARYAGGRVCSRRPTLRVLGSGVLLGSYEICSCCRYEYGVTDADRGISHEQWRQQWIAAGMPWRRVEEDPPANWDPRAQLHSIGFDLPSE